MISGQAQSPTRPALRWHGGKWRLAPWIIGHFPLHRVYVEPFGGAASVLLRKPRSYAEIYNDLDAGVVTLFRVLREDDAAQRLQQQLWLTPFAREEWRAAYEPASDPVESARRLIVRSYMGFGSDSGRIDVSTGFRSNSSRSGSVPAADWRNYPDAVSRLVERLRGVVIESRDAAEVIRQHDGRDTLFYVDPPYVHGTRVRVDRARGYAHELSDQGHEALLQQLCDVAGAVVLSGYPCALYDRMLKSWRRVQRKAHADGAGARIEVLWLNAKAAEGGTASLFDGENGA